MKKISIKNLVIFVISLLLVSLPAMATAQTEQTKSIPPPISQPLMTEGALAVNLVSVLGVSSTADEVAAESDLGDIGIIPRNGWIAEYPVTPDIVAEVRQSVADAADDEQLSIKRDEALKRFDDVIAGFGLTVRSYTSGESAMDKPVTCENYPNPSIISNAYGSEGPPIVTYYCPPPDYYDQYAWVPYPFWWSDFWFPGFFILRDFHRHVFFHHHFVLYSNHFNDIRRHHVFRIDPVERFHGRTFAGIGVKSSGSFISTGVPRSSHTIFNAPRGGVPGGSGGIHGGINHGGSGGAVHGGSGGSMHGGRGGSVHGGRGGGMRR